MKNVSATLTLLLLSCCARAQAQPPAQLPPRLTAQTTALPDHAQPASLTLQTCYDLATQNYPLIQQRELIRSTREYSLDNASKGWLPQVNFSGQATYQSQTIAFPFKIPGATLPVYSKDQYRVQAEIDQTIYDAGAIKYQRQLKGADEDIHLQSLEVDLYALKDRINQLFFGILLIDEQLRLNALQRSDLRNGVDKIQASVINGTALHSSLDELRAEVLRAEQDSIELRASRKAYTQMLSLFINKPLDQDTKLLTPAPVTGTKEIKRPELALFDYRKRAFDIQERQLGLTYMPKVSAFAQGAYGRPTLNFISNDFGFWALGGVRFSWSLSGLYTNKNDKRLLTLDRKDLDIQKETFLFNTGLTLTQQNAESEKYQALAELDEKIIELRTSVKAAALAQLQNGVITSHDYVNQVNAESQARQSLNLHRIEFLQSQYNTKTTIGN